MFNNLRIQTKLAILCSAFLLPIVFLAYLLAAQTSKDTRFAAQELEGSAYVKALLAELDAIVALSQGTGTAAEVTRVQAEVRKVDAGKAVPLNAADAASKAASAVRAAAGLPVGAPDDAYAPAISAVLDHISKVADGSNLTLDPDLDSFYTQDFVTARLPHVVSSASRVLASGQELIGAHTATTAATVFFLSQKAELAASLASLDSDIESAVRGNVDGTFKPTVDAAYADFAGKAAAYMSLLNTVVGAGGTRPSAMALAAAEAALRHSATSVSDASLKELDHLLTARISDLQTKQWWRFGLTGVLLLATMAFAWWIAQSISRPIRAMTSAMVGLSHGDANIEVPMLGTSGEIGDMAGAVNIFKANADKIIALMRAENVTKEIGDIISSAASGDFTPRVRLDDKTGFLRDIGEQVNRLLDSTVEAFKKILAESTHAAIAADECSRAVRQVAADAHNQFAALSQLAGTIGRTTKQISRVSSDAGDAGKTARSSATLVGQGESSLSELFTKMESIGTNSRRISQITEVIGQIANKTHILSLNAAIEAARAGEHGKGFVVVAQEVGKLAEGAAQQSYSISQIVEQATADAQSGLLSASSVRSFMSQISAEVASTNGKVRSIAEAMDQQNSAVEEINSTVGDLEQIARSNAATAEQIATTVSGLLHAAESTRNLVGRFKTI